MVKRGSAPVSVPASAVTKEVVMSYISELSPASLASANMSYTQDTAGPALPTDGLASPSAKLAGGLEVTILLAMLSGLSLAFCTIAAGAF